MAEVTTKRIHEPAAESDGTRVLVDRIWPRGMRKDAAALDLWLKHVAPSKELRQWFGHDPDKWPEFQRRYHAELDARPEALRPRHLAAWLDLAGQPGYDDVQTILRRWSGYAGLVYLHLLLYRLDADG